jgi:hypothetical protein
MKDLNERSYNEVLTEASDYFASQGVSIIGEGYKEIATNPALFESYVDQLTEGTSADHAAEMAQIMVNTNQSILRESSMTGIQPVASLSMPVIRKLWPKFAIKEAIKTEVAKSPRFVVSYTKPYMFKGDEKVWLVKGLADEESGLMSPAHESLKKEFTELRTLSLSAGGADVIDFKHVPAVAAVGTEGQDGYVPGVAAHDDAHVVIADTPSHVKVQPLDELIIEECKLGNEVIKLGKRLSVYGSQVYDLKAGVKLLVQFDGKACSATFALIGGSEACTLKVKAGVSSEFNEESWSVGFDIARQDVDIPTGKHLNAPLPIEALNDMQALYQIDGTKETVDLMTNVFAMKLDVEILDFIINSLLSRPTNEAFFEGYAGASEFKRTFDCKPAAGFAGSPKAWREELKPVIDYLAAKIKNETYLQGGIFSIVCNPIDAQILANVDWSFRAGQGSIDGVAVDYSVGTYVGANTYKVIASTNVPAGGMYIVFTPSSETQMTYKHYAYSYSTEMGYVDPNRSRVPSVMMTARYTQFEFMPAVGCIEILHNDGQGYFASSVKVEHVGD